LDDLDKNPNGLSDDAVHGVVRKMLWQILKAVEYLHSHNVHIKLLIYIILLNIKKKKY